LVGIIVLLVSTVAFVLLSTANSVNQVAQNSLKTVTVRTETEKALYLRNETIRFRTFLTNVGNETITAGGVKVTHNFVNSTGAPIFFAIRTYTYMAERPFVLAPQNSRELRPAEEWDQNYYTFYTQGAESKTVTLKAPPGDYVIETTVTLSGCTLNGIQSGENWIFTPRLLSK